MNAPYEAGARVLYTKYGTATVVGMEPSGIRVLFDVPPRDLDFEAEDVVAFEDLIEASPYSDEETIDIIGKQLSLLFSAGDWVCFTYIHPTKKTTTGSAATKNEIVCFEEATSRPYIEKLIERNRDWNVYVAQNPLKEGSTQRTKESAAQVCNVFCEVDENGEQCLAEIRGAAAAGEIPKPSAIAQSSAGKFQFVWRINSSDFNVVRVEQINRALVSRFGSDPACTDALRVFRVWALRNHKYPQKPFVRIREADAAGCYNFADFKIALNEEKNAVVKPAASDQELCAVAGYFEEAAAEANITISPLKKWGTNGFLWEIHPCPWVSEHTGQKDSGTIVLLHNSAALSFKCQHGHCAERTWTKDMRPKLEELVGHPLRFGDPVGNVIFGATDVTQSALASPSPASVWGEPQPFENSLLPVPPFQLEFLPRSLQPWVKDVAQRMSVPLDFAGICALAVLAGVVNRRAFVYPKQNDKEWKEALAISGAIIAASGRLKTPTWKTFTNVLLEIEYDWRGEHQRMMDSYKQETKKYEESLKAFKKAKDNSVCVGDPPQEPLPCRRVMLNDATPEMMHQIMTENPEGLFIYRDEMASWLAELDKEGREVERGLFLAAMNGNDGYAIDRIGRGSVFATMSASLFGGFQPDLLVEFLSDTRNVSDGMVARFGLLCWPDGAVLPRVDRMANDEAKLRFRRVLRTLAVLKAETIFLHFAPEAQVRFNAWYDEHDRKVNQEVHSGRQSHLSKYRGLLPKLAGLLQLADIVDAAPSSPVGNHLIDLEHLDGAIALLAYLEAHMTRVYASIRSPEQKALDSLVKHIRKGDLQSGFALRDLRRKCWENLSSDGTTINDALESLEEMSWLRLLPTEKNSKGGRPTFRWEINPALIHSQENATP